MQKCAAPNYCHLNYRAILTLHYCSDIIPSSNKILNLRVGILPSHYKLKWEPSAITSSFKDGVP